MQKRVARQDHYFIKLKILGQQFLYIANIHAWPIVTVIDALFAVGAFSTHFSEIRFKMKMHLKMPSEICRHFVHDSTC